MINGIHLKLMCIKSVNFDSIINIRYNIIIIISIIIIIYNIHILL